MTRFEFSQRTKTKSVSKTLNILFNCIYVLTCMDFGFSLGVYKRMKVLENISLVLRVMVAIMCAAMVMKQDILDSAWADITLTESLLVIVSFKLSKPKLSYRELLENLSIVDETQGAPPAGYKVERKLITYIAGVTALRLTVLCLYCVAHTEQYSIDNFIEFLYNVPCYCLDLYLIVHFIIFHSIYCRLRTLRKALSNNFDVYRAHLIYKTLIDCTEEIKKCLDIPVSRSDRHRHSLHKPMGTFLKSYRTPRVMFQLVVILIATILVVMVNVLVTLRMLFKGESIISAFLLRYIEVILSLALLFVPVLVADMMALEAHKIHIFLHGRMQTANDLAAEERREVRQFAHYVGTRPFRLRACHVLALDSSLPITVVSVCVTYLIVIVQFTHLY
ncbi:uncharacterized protein LOC114252143 [Bombyx mandarina]|uniref:Uncharacterized protein LOC114252143 n=1 Tax=Bombyx mandarina TaxID=7092 RepID=A0A6J2KLM9_BOMMA|nr:uncharacterized protein LOC114252143 [Bombyx mandarina]